MIHRITLLAIVLLCAGCATGTPAPPPQASLSGTATFRERMALPPGAVFEATIEDVSRAGAKAEVIGHTRIESPGNPPIHFTISYDPTTIVARNRYVVRARITLDGTLLFTTDTAYPVLVPGTPDNPQLLLRRVGTNAPAPTASIENVEWHLWQIGSAPVVVDKPWNIPRLTLQSGDGRVTGHGGCNSMTGTYTLSGNQLRFGPIAASRMACPDMDTQERAFHQALAATTAWRLNGATLELLDATNQIVATMERKP